MIDLAGVRSRVFPMAMRARVETLAEGDPEVRSAVRVLGEARVLPWAHSFGVCSDPGLAAMVPAVPPRELRARVGEPDAEIFLWTGILDLDVVLAAWEAHGRPPREPTPSILDLGCGCGRLLRFLAACTDVVSVHGAEAEADLAGWCRTHLPGIAITPQGPGTRIGAPDATFDFVYSVSVVAYLAEDAIGPWLDEVARILVPAGLFVVTVPAPPSGQGGPQLGRMAASRGYGVVDIVAAGMRGWQDVVVLRRAP